jgi:competence protein ComEC
MAQCDSQASWARGLVEIAEHCGVAVGWLARGDTLRVGDRSVVCLWPPEQVDLEETNDHSVVLRLGPPGRQLLATGDLERGAERRLLDMGSDLRARVLKVGHHGGNTGTDEGWLQRIAAQWTILSCGENNRHGHPHAAVVGRLETSGAGILRTDHRGAVGLRWGKDGLWVGQVGPP